MMNATRWHHEESFGGTTLAPLEINGKFTSTISIYLHRFYYISAIIQSFICISLYFTILQFRQKALEAPFDILPNSNLILADFLIQFWRWYINKKASTIIQYSFLMFYMYAPSMAKITLKRFPFARIIPSYVYVIPHFANRITPFFNFDKKPHFVV